MKVRCRTNLDGFGSLGWPTQLPALPHVGDRIQASSKSPKGYFVELEVHSVSFVPEAVHDIPDPKNFMWIPVIELNIPRIPSLTIPMYYERHFGRQL